MRWHRGRLALEVAPIGRGDQIETKLSACRCYESQGLAAAESPLLSLVKTTSAYFGGRIGSPYAEPFYSHEVIGFSGLDQLV